MHLRVFFKWDLSTFFLCNFMFYNVLPSIYGKLKCHLKRDMYSYFVINHLIILCNLVAYIKIH